ncbi:MAG: hypothetical protein KDC24_03560 [Saprospiraceae bacterium]|nr:hypothetical protein [Saprospiraceae bacterium]
MENNISNTGVFGIDIVQSPEIEGLGDKFTGEGRSGHLIILKNNNHTNNNLEFLKKVFQAVNLNLSSDCFLLDLGESDSIMVGPVLRKNKIQTMISFGVDTANLGLQIHLQRYQIAHLESQKLLLADDLDSIQKNETLKRNLWNALKELYKPA